MRNFALYLPLLLLSSCALNKPLEQRFMVAIQDQDLIKAKSMLCVTSGDMFLTSATDYKLGETKEENLFGYNAISIPAEVDGEKYKLIKFETEIFANFAIAQAKEAFDLGLDIPAPAPEELSKGKECITFGITD